jgi:hypothetical protein
LGVPGKATNSSNNTARVFSKYAFITQQLEDETLVAISAGPLPIDVKPFSEDEIAVLDVTKTIIGR